MVPRTRLYLFHGMYFPDRNHIPAVPQETPSRVLEYMLELCISLRIWLMNAD